ncbi:methyltransferase domain-containing protein [Planktomarina temperata]|nr:methyltransferase domain-containing protein [Planktomarina temperata]MDC1094174.1 methyltransferase domain-containing protein [Planktomarina temperata]
MLKLNLGCAGRPIPGYVNIDLDDVEAMRERYPNMEITDDIKIYQYDIFNLPYENETVDEIKSDAFLEHLSFKEEKMFFLEAKRVLKRGGLLKFSVPDFEAVVRLWLEAEDNWLDFYRDDEEAIRQTHWFGTYSYEMKNRWGYLIASIFGPQHGEGQFHKNAYTKNKIENMCSFLGLRILVLQEYRWKGNRDFMLDVVTEKI